MQDAVVDNAEDDGGASDADGEGENGQERKSQVLAEAVPGVAQIIQKFVQARFRADVTAFFFETLDAAEFEVRTTPCCGSARPGRR